MQSEQLLCWSGMTDTKHSSTSGSNEEEERVISAKKAGYSITSQNKLERIIL